MHVLFIATPDLSYISGSSLSLRYTVEALSRRGIRSTVLCQKAPPQSAYPLVDYREIDMPLDYQIITDTHPTDAELFQCTRLLCEAAIQTSDADLVHAIYGTFTGLAGAISAALAEVPLAISSFGRDVAHGATADARYRRMMRMSYGAADLIFAADEQSASALASDFARCDAKVLIVPPGVEFGVMRHLPHRVRTAPARRLLAVQSSFNAKKGLAYIIEALSTLQDEFSELELIVVGHDDTPDKHNEHRLKSLADRLGVAERITYTGHLSHRQVLAKMTECDVLVDPREINSFSNCVYEAMTLGVPIVASDVACNAQALGHDERGILVAAGDSTALAKGIREILLDETRAKTLASAGENYAASLEGLIGTDQIAARLEAAYMTVINP